MPFYNSFIHIFPAKEGNKVTLSKIFSIFRFLNIYQLQQMELNLREEMLFYLHSIGDRPLQILVAFTNFGCVFPLGWVNCQITFRLYTVPCSGPLCVVHAYLNMLCLDRQLPNSSGWIVWFNALYHLGGQPSEWELQVPSGEYQLSPQHIRQQVLSHP